jgi:hypothetical protein
VELAQQGKSCRQLCAAYPEEATSAQQLSLNMEIHRTEKQTLLLKDEGDIHEHF